MSKAVMLSIRPKWCEKICCGEKTIEVRKTRPKMNTPFKCYIYCTLQGCNEFFRVDLGRDVAKWNRGKWADRKGKIIGEFTCDRIYELAPLNHAPDDVEKQACLTREEIVFQSTRPARGATAKVNKFLCTFLQKRHGFQISLRKTLPFKAFCRLQIGKNFSICGANRCGNFCELLLRTIRSSVLPEGRSACSQNAQFYSHTFSRDNRNADCLFPDP